MHSGLAWQCIGGVDMSMQMLAMQQSPLGSAIDIIVCVCVRVRV